MSGDIEFADQEDFDHVLMDYEPLRTDRRFCPHCSKSLSLKTFKAHKRRFYNSQSEVWYKSQWMSETQSLASSSSSSLEDLELYSPPDAIGESEEDLDDSESPPMSDALSERAPDSEMTRSSTSESEVESEPEVEIWDEEKQVSNIMCDIEDTEDDLSPSKCPSMPTDMSVQFNKPGILTNWLIAFLLVIKGKYHLTDRVVNLVFKFLKLFLEIAGRFSSFCRILAEHFPSTLYKAQKLHEYKHNFKRYVVCKRCHRLYHFQDCIEEVGMQKRSRVCWYRQFGREECKGLLLKSVELCSGKRIFYPYVTYCFLGIKSPLQSMLNRPDFVDLCEEWRVRSVHDNVIADIYDGETWKKFQFVDGKPFLSEPFSYGMMISVDWFQPFKHLTYSVGVVFLTIMNLPRALRYHQENVILAGILPGPREPHLTMNSYLEPLVDELLHFWNGVEMDTTVGKKLVRCAVMCASCDLPAGRKLCGFLGHAAFLGCSKCKKGFPGSIGQKDYSGFDRENWPRRTDQSHRRDTAQLLNCKSMKQLKEKELSLGCRYSCLLKLPYFDAPRMLAVDPMHNLFCGTAKYYVHHIWLKHSLLTSANFEVIQDRINRTVIPPDVGRIPSKILSGFSSLTADQLKNWTVYYSLIALRGMLIGDDLEVWRHFVLACRILCCREITREKLRLADALLLKFCKRTERMYGKECVTPNMHMHCHLRECIEDYGPIAAFWLFPYERFNGILGEMPNNNRSIEIQLMKRFLCDQEVLSISLPDEFHEEFSPLFRNVNSVGSVGETMNSYNIPNESRPSTDSCRWTVDDLQVVLPKHHTMSTFDTFQLQCLKKMYSSLYCIQEEDVIINSAYQKYVFATLNGKVLGRYKSRSKSSSIVIASWNPQMFCHNYPEEYDSCFERPVRIEFFAQHTVTLQTKAHTHLLFSALWFKPHPKKDFYGKPLTVWEPDIYELSGVNSLIPVQFIRKRTASLVDRIDCSGSVLFVCPLIHF